MDFRLKGIVVVNTRYLKKADWAGYAILQIKSIEPDEGVGDRDAKHILLELEYPDRGKETEWVLGSEVREATEEEEAIYYFRVLRDY